MSRGGRDFEVSRPGSFCLKKPDASPCRPPAWEPADAAAIQALLRGDATSDQQLRAIKYIVNDIAGTYDLSYRSGEDGRRDTDFAEGKRHVGLQIVKLSKLNLAALRQAKSTQETGK